MPISLQPDVVFFKRSNSLSLKVSKVNIITRLQRYRYENIWVRDKNSVSLGRFLLYQSIKENNFLKTYLKIQIFLILSPTFVLSDVRTSPTFVLVRRLSWSDVWTVRRLYHIIAYFRRSKWNKIDLNIRRIR